MATQTGLELSVSFHAHTRMFSQIFYSRAVRSYVITAKSQSDHFQPIEGSHDPIASVLWDTQIYQARDDPFHQPCRCCKVRGKEDVQTCAEQGDFMIPLTPHERSWRTVGSILLVGTNHLCCGPVSQPALKENRRGMIGEPL